MRDADGAVMGFMEMAESMMESLFLVPEFYDVVVGGASSSIPIARDPATAARE
jgi:hypothetical protein